MFTQTQKKNIPAYTLEFVCQHCPCKCKVSVAKIKTQKQQITDNTVYSIDELGEKWVPTFKSPLSASSAKTFTTYIDKNNEKQSAIRSTALEALELAKNTMIPLCDHYQLKR